MLLTFALLSCVAVAPVGHQQPTWTAATVDAAVARYGQDSLSPSDSFRAVAVMDRSSNLVKIRWSYSSTSDFSGPPELYLSQNFAVSFIPTAVAFVNPSHAVVAGTIGNQTVVEVWHLKVPVVKPTGLVGQTKKSARLVYKESQGNVPGIIRTLIDNRGANRSVFMRFTGSPDIYELTWPVSGNGAAVVVLAAAQHPGLSASPYNEPFGGDHVTLGYTYILRVEDALHLHDAFVMVDTNRDGIIDSTALWDFQTFETNEAIDMTKWLDYAGQKPPL